MIPPPPPPKAEPSVEPRGSAVPALALALVPVVVTLAAVVIWGWPR